jgi:hypothetical protein
MNKAQWKVFYRMLRIHRREASKAWTDMLLFGSGWLDLSGPEPRHVPYMEMYL